MKASFVFLFKDDTDSEISFDRGKSEKCEKELSNINFRKHRRTSRFMEREKDALNNRANSLKKALRNLVSISAKKRNFLVSFVSSLRWHTMGDIKKRFLG